MIVITKKCCFRSLWPFVSQDSKTLLALLFAVLVVTCTLQEMTSQYVSILYTLICIASWAF